jgi:hypothetical protein
MAMQGTIVQIDRQHQRGSLKGDDRKVRPFERGAMVRWLQFEELSPGTRVIFELEKAGGVINVERVGDG